MQRDIEDFSSGTIHKRCAADNFPARHKKSIRREMFASSYRPNTLNIFDICHAESESAYSRFLLHKVQDGVMLSQ